MAFQLRAHDASIITRISFFWTWRKVAMNHFVTIGPNVTIGDFDQPTPLAVSDEIPVVTGNNPDRGVTIGGVTSSPTIQRRWRV